MPRASISSVVITAIMLALTARPAAAADDTLGRLRWGVDPGTGSSWRVAALRRRLAAGGDDSLARALRSLLRHAEEDIAHDVRIAPLPRIEIEGVLPSDARYRASEVGLRSLPSLFCWAFCARVREGEAAQACRRRAVDGILAWVRVYEPTGNPIDEAHLLELVEAADLVLSQLPGEQRVTVEHWLARLIEAGDRYQSAKSPRAPSRLNNQEAWHLANRAIAARVLGSSTADDTTATAMRRLLARNLAADDGSSFDFHQRDALHYHVYALEAFTHVLLLAPDVIDADGRGRIRRALEFLRPYYSGRRRHVEFVHSTVAFDQARRLDGVSSFAHRAWDPTQARRLLRLARTQFPALRGWTDDVVDDHYHPVVKLEAALFGG